LEKNSQDKLSSKFVIDTSYLLPIVGIEVEGLNQEDIDKIFRFELYYPMSLIPELIGVIIKEAKKMRLDRIPKEAIEGLNSIIYGGYVKLISPEGEDIEIAYELIRKGCNDIFDALLYATGKRLRLKILSMDKLFRKFLKEHKYDYGILTSHKEIIITSND